jgi:hypothetical protein
MKKEVMFHCGNAPKMERVIDLTIALADKDAKAAKSHVREDFVWNEIGKGEIAKYENLGDVLSNRPGVSKILVTNGLSHGNGAMCEGELQFADNTALFFCSVVQFVNTAKDALVKELHMYFIRKTA